MPTIRFVFACALVLFGLTAGATARPVAARAATCSDDTGVLCSLQEEFTCTRVGYCPSSIFSGFVCCMDGTLDGSYSYWSG